MSYLIKTIIRRIVNIIIKPRNLITVIVVFAILFSFLRINGYCLSVDMSSSSATSSDVQTLITFYKNQNDTSAVEFANFALPHIISNDDFYQKILKPYYIDTISYKMYKIVPSSHSNYPTSTTEEQKTPKYLTWDVYYSNSFGTYSSSSVSLNLYDVGYKFTGYNYYVLHGWFSYDNSNNSYYYYDEGETNYFFAPYELAGSANGSTSGSYHSPVLLELQKICNSLASGGSSGSIDYTGLLTSINDYCKSINSLISVTQEEISQMKETVQDILNLIQNNSNGKDYSQQLNQMQETLDKSQKSLEDVKDFFQSEDVADDSYNLPTQNTDDITESGFDNIFSMIQNKLTSDEFEDIIIPIPFTDKNITIDPDFLYKALGENNLIVVLVSSLTYFFVSVFIVKDISRIIEKIKTGDITTSSETNIKTDML